MTHQDIVNKVKDILNEHGEVDALSISDDRVQLENYIAVAIPDAVVMLASKGYRVNVVSFSNAKGFGDVVSEDLIFEDFISLIYATSLYWKKDVTELTELNSPAYKMAQNPYTAPGPNNPIGYLGLGYGLIFLPDIDGNDQPIKIYGFYNAKYHPYKDNGEIDEKYELKACPKEATAVCYMTAALVLGMFGDDQGKQRLSDISTNMLN